MLCDKCNHREANVFIERTINGEKEKFALCGECAATMEKELPFTIDLGSFFSGVNPFGANAVEQTQKTVCSHCGMSFGEFEKNGRLGCANCYEDFRSQLVPIIKRIHGSLQHSVESGGADEKKLVVQELKAKLSEAILNENYEEAAKLRDEIKLHKEAESK